MSRKILVLTVVALAATVFYVATGVGQQAAAPGATPFKKRKPLGRRRANGLNNKKAVMISLIFQRHERAIEFHRPADSTRRGQNARIRFRP